MIDFSVTGDRQVIGYLRGISPKLVNALVTQMERSMIELSRYVKQQKLSGQVLKNRSGTLRRKINALVTKSLGAIIGSVGAKVAYAAAHEYGIDKIVQVKAHSRQMNAAFGRPVAMPRQIQVAAHAMHMKLPERSFLRSSLRELSPKIFADLDSAAVRAIQ